MLLAGFLILFFLLILYLLLAPIVLFIDTATNQYYVRLKGLAKLNIEPDEKELLRIKLKIFFLSFYFYPLKKIGSSKSKKTVKPTSRKSGKRIGFGKSMRVLRSFKVKRLLLNIDTGDCIWNAKLYPIFALLNYNIGEFSINFEGRNQLALQLQNRPINIIRSFINF